MKRATALRLAQQDINRLYEAGWGLFRIAEQHGIDPVQLANRVQREHDETRNGWPEHLRQGRPGILTERYVRERMADQWQWLDETSGVKHIQSIADMSPAKSVESRITLVKAAG